MRTDATPQIKSMIGCIRRIITGGLKTMKKLFYLLFILFFSVLTASAQITPAGKTWNLADCGNGSGARTSNCTSIGSSVKTLFNFDTGNGVTLDGWEYSSDVSGYGSHGYLLTGTDPNVGITTSTPKIQTTRSFDKTDYGEDTVLVFDTGNIAPTTSAGASAHFTSGAATADNQITWWLWYDSYELYKRGITNRYTDRMSFYIKFEGIDDMVNGSDGSNYGFHVGTYTCAYVDGVSGCPYEGPGNNHWYHYLGFNSGAWIHAELDEQPQHERGVGGVHPPTNPVVAKYGDPFTSYYANLHQFYMELTQDQPQQTQMWLDEVEFYSTRDTYEPNQNQKSISSVWVGYWGVEDRWQISWSDSSRSGYGTFEIRWSYAPITNNNFSSANEITPLHYTGGQYESNVSASVIRSLKPGQIVWTAFTLPSAATVPGTKVYFAIKDISETGQNAGTLYPWTNSDSSDAPTPFIRTIDYVVP